MSKKASRVMYPFETITVLMPLACASRAMSMTYSPQIVGSLYVNAMWGELCSIAKSTTCRGGRSAELTWSDLALEMSQFWQKKQPMLQPAVPIDRIFVPGKK